MSIFVYSQYSTDVPLVTGSIAKLKLDPITTAGVVNDSVQEELGRFSPFACDAWKTLNDRSHFESKLLPSALPSKDIPVARKSWAKTKTVWKTHIIQLKGFNVLAVATMALLMVSTYFAVAKSCGILARTIFSGRRLSLLFVRPQSVNLPQIPHLLARAATILASCAGIYVLTSDVRHYFHSISLGPDVRQFFTIFCADTLYQFCVLPMGWSHSPRIAQCLAWAAILSLASVENGLIDAANVLKSSEHPPSFVVLRDNAGRAIGLLFIWYDNFVALVGDKDVATALSSTMNKMTKKFHFHWGQKALSHPAQLKKLGNSSMKDIEEAETRGDEVETKFLKKEATAVGIQFGMSTKRSRNSERSVIFQWRLKPSTIDKAKLLRSMLCATTSQLTCRLVAAICGVCVWRVYVSGEPLTRIHEVIDLSSKAGQKARASGWAANLSLTVQSTKELSTALEDVMRNDWRTVAPLRSEADATIFVATDASLIMGAWCLLGSESVRLDWHNWHWVEQVSDQKATPSEEIIFLLELDAAVRAIFRFAAKDTLLVLLIDNTAAAACLRRMYTPHPEGRKLVTDAWNHLKAMACRLLVVGIPSEDNDADSPTRGVKSHPAFDEGRLKRSYNTALKALEGLERTKLNPNVMLTSHSHYDDALFEAVGFCTEAHDTSNDEDTSDVDGRCDGIVECLSILASETSLDKK